MMVGQFVDDFGRPIGEPEPEPEPTPPPAPSSADDEGTPFMEPGVDGRAPAGFATVFPGWNVWRVQVADELDTELLMVGVSNERRLRIFVEDAADTGAGVAVADPLNPAALKGSQVEIIGGSGTLETFENQSQRLGANLLVNVPSRLVTVRFFNRGGGALITWPATFPDTKNFVLESVFKPDPNNPLTSGPAPGSLAGSASTAAEGLKETLKIVAIVAGVGLGVVLLVSIINSSRKAAA